MADIDEIEGLDIAIPEEGPVEVKLDQPLEQSKSEQAEDEREIALADLRKQLDEQRSYVEKERNARLQAEESARRHSEEAEFAKIETHDSNLKVIVNAIDAVEQSALNAERSYTDAMQAGDYAAAAKAQRAMASAESQLSQLYQAKTGVENYIRSHVTEGRVEAPKPEIRQMEAPQDPVEMLANRLTPKSAAWLRNNPQAAGQVNKLTAAHTAAVELEGIPVESPEYFAYIEQRLGLSGEKKNPSISPPTKKAMASAPVNNSSSYSNPTGRSSNGDTMHLTSAEVEMAILAEPDLPRQKALEAYARNKAECIRRGELRN